jgi:hypothetical protein
MPKPTILPDDPNKLKEMIAQRDVSISRLEAENAFLRGKLERRREAMRRARKTYAKAAMAQEYADHWHEQQMRYRKISWTRTEWHAGMARAAGVHPRQVERWVALDPPLVTFTT